MRCYKPHPVFQARRLRLPHVVGARAAHGDPALPHPETNIDFSHETCPLSPKASMYQILSNVYHETG